MATTRKILRACLYASLAAGLIPGLPGCSDDDSSGQNVSGRTTLRLTTEVNSWEQPGSRSQLSSGRAIDVINRGVTSSGIEYMDFIDVDGFETRAFQMPVAPRTRSEADEVRMARGNDVGVFMVTSSGKLPADIVDRKTSVAADNKHYIITDAEEGTLSAAQGDIYYPKSGNVDIIAYFPYDGLRVTDDYAYQVDVSEQDTAEKQAVADIMYSKVENVSRSDEAVKLDFEHRLGKITLNIKVYDIPKVFTDVAFTGMPASAEMSLQDGSLKAGSISQTGFSATRSAHTVPDMDVTYTAIVVPQEAGAYPGRAVEFTIDGKQYTWDMPAGEAFESGKHYTYPVWIHKDERVEVGAPVINDWTEHTNTSSLNVELLAVKIPAGTFLMGSSDGSNIGNADGSGLNTTPKEPGRISTDTGNEIQHKVTISRDFYISKHLITAAQFAMFLNEAGVGSNGAYVTGEQLTGDSTYGVIWNDNTNSWMPNVTNLTMPEDYATWYGAYEFATWLGGSLPTEAEWEYACRGGQEESLPYGIGTGRKLEAGMANYATYYSYDLDADPPGQYVAGVSSLGYPSPVGYYSSYPNSYGLYDMHGNLWEWCLYGPYRYSADPVTDPRSSSWPPSSGSAVIRGGGYMTNPTNCRTAYRSWTTTDRPNGFRIVFRP